MPCAVLADPVLPPVSENLSISAEGRVVDSTGAPVADATVLFREAADLRFSEDPWQPSRNDVLATTVSDSQGRFQFQKIPAQPFRFDHATDNRATPWSIVVQARGFANAWKALPAVSEPRPIEFALTAESRLRGKVVDEQNRPIANVAVNVAGFGSLADARDTAENPAPVYSLTRSQLSRVGMTDADGRFDIAGMPRDRVELLSFEHKEFARQALFAATSDQSPAEVVLSSWGTEQPVQPNSGKVLTGELQVVLKPGRRLSGLVKFEESGAPVSGARILMGNHFQGTHTVTDKEGRFSFHSLSATELPLTVLAPLGSKVVGRRTIVKFQEQQWVTDIELMLPHGQEIAGTVVDEKSGLGVAGVSIVFDPANPDNAAEVLLPQETVSDQEGRFRLVVPPGAGRVWVCGELPHYDLRSKSFVPFARTAYRVLNVRRGPSGRPMMTRSSGRGPDARTFQRFFEEVEVKADQPVPDLRFTIGRGKVAQGTVTGPDGQPAANVEVLVKLSDPDSQRQPLPIVAMTDKAGKFKLDGLPLAASHLFRFADRPRKLASLAFVAAVNTDDATAGVNLDVTLQPVGQAAGRVLSGEAPARGARVALYFTRFGANGPPSFSPDSYYGLVEADEEGRFQIDGLAKGVYRPRFMAQGTLSRYGQALEITAGELIQVEPIALTPLNKSISGVVVNDEGKPVAGMEIRVLTYVQETWGAITMTETVSLVPRGTGAVLTDKDGRFTFAGVPKQPVVISIFDPAAIQREGAGDGTLGKATAEGGATDVVIKIK
jgi:protocatechuate 3,4-dioxygenase beta subunit